MIKKIILLTIILSVIIISPVVYSDDEVQIRIAEQRIERNINSLSPTYTNVETTVYYTPSCEDKTSWCSPEKGSCFETTRQIVDYYGDNYNVRSCVEDRRAGWCCIPEEHRGVYEEIKCQGSGVCENSVFYHSQLRPTQADSVALDTKFTSGITSRQTDPRPKWTIAVNPIPNTPGHIPYETYVYLYFSQNHPWNGIYKAEDTGSAFRGQPKIDIYAGVGRAARDEAMAAGISGQTPLVFLLDEDLSIAEQLTQGVTPSIGDHSAKYQKSITFDSPLQTFERARILVQQTNSPITTSLESVLSQNDYELCLHKQPREIFEIEYSGSTPIYYKFESEWLWSADQLNWMQTNTHVVSEGRFKNREPIQEQKEIIDQLNDIRTHKNRGEQLLYQKLKDLDSSKIYYLLETQELQLLANIRDCIATRKDCYCNINVDQETNISQINDQFYINNNRYRVNFLLELDGEKEFEFVFEEEFNLLIEEETSEKKIKIITKEELEEIANEFVDELEQEIFGSQGIIGFVDDVLGVDLFSNIPFVDVATGFLNPSMLVTNILLSDNFDIVSFATGKSTSQIKDSLLNPSWLLDLDNEDSPIDTCTAPQINHFVCDKQTDLNFAIELYYDGTSISIFEDILGIQIPGQEEISEIIPPTIPELEQEQEEETDDIEEEFDPTSGSAQSFIIKTEEIAMRLNMDPMHLLAIMDFETGGQFRPDTRNPVSGATGLIQFMNGTAQWLGTTVEELAQMTRLEQLDYVEEYFRRRIITYGELDTLDKAYAAVLCPQSIVHSEGIMFTNDGSGTGACDRDNPLIAYQQNRGLDRNNDGIITREEAAQSVINRYEVLAANADNLETRIPTLT